MVKIKAYFEKDNNTVELDINENSTILDVLKDNNVVTSEVIVTKNNELVTEDETLTEGDEIKILSVISGG